MIPRARMLPGQEPYAEVELAGLSRLVADAADGDPGEAEEWRYLSRPHERPER